MTLYILLAVITGALGAVHVPINGALGVRIQSTLVATFAFYGVAFLIIASASLALEDRAAFAALASVPRWYFVAGAISVLVVGSSTFLIPRIGAINLFVIFLTSQLAVRMVLSHFGWLESPLSPINPVKIFGALLLVAGAILVVRE